jgi:hypothetical protein
VGERDEDVVVAAAVAQPPLGVDARHRPQQHQGLVDQVAAEVEQRAAARGRRAGLGCEPLEAATPAGVSVPRRPASTSARTVRKSESQRRFW